MGELANVAADIPLFRGSYNGFLDLGEKATADAFELTIIGSATPITYLVQTAQIPEMKREVIESYGPHGVQFKQQGRPIKSVDITIQFVETLDSVAYAVLYEWVVNKMYVTVKLKMVSESNRNGQEWLLENCWIEMDAADLSVEDGTLLKMPATLHANWVHFPTA